MASCVAEEEEANDFAQDVLRPAGASRRLAKAHGQQEGGECAYAIQIGISKGIVVGQLQNRGIIAQNMLNGLKQRYIWGEDDTLQVSP